MVARRSNRKKDNTTDKVVGAGYQVALCVGNFCGYKDQVFAVSMEDLPVGGQFYAGRWSGCFYGF